MADKTKEYTVKTEGFIHGTFQAEKSTVTLTEKQAQTFLREGRIVPKGAKPAAKKAD